MKTTSAKESRLKPLYFAARNERLVERVVAMINKEYGTDIDIDDPESRTKYAMQLNRIDGALETARAALQSSPQAEIMLPLLMSDDAGDIVNFECAIMRDEMERLTLAPSALHRNITVRRPLKFNPR